MEVNLADPSAVWRARGRGDACARDVCVMVRGKGWSGARQGDGRVGVRRCKPPDAWSVFDFLSCLWACGFWQPHPTSTAW